MHIAAWNMALPRAKSRPRPTDSSEPSRSSICQVRTTLRFPLLDEIDREWHIPSAIESIGFAQPTEVLPSQGRRPAVLDAPQDVQIVHLLLLRLGPLEQTHR